ncbi:MAG: hypothetical protein ACKOTZ_01050 [Chloroflexota bacterium]
MSVRPIRAVALAALAAALVAPSASLAADPTEMTTDAAAAEWRSLSCPGNLAEVAVLDAVTAAGIAPGDPLTDELRAASATWADRLAHAAVRLTWPAAPWPAAIRADVGRVAGLETLEAERVGALARAGSVWAEPLSADEVAFETAAVDRIRTALGLPLASDCTDADAPPAVLSAEEAAAAWFDAICPLNAVGAAVADHASSLPDPMAPDDLLRLHFARYAAASGRAADLLAHPLTPWPAEIADAIDRQIGFFVWQRSLYAQLALADVAIAPESGEESGRSRDAADAIRAALGLGERGTGCPA